jgi:hypothetical protein
MSAFDAEKNLVNGAYELLILLENKGIHDSRQAHICLSLCQTYNHALSSGGLPGPEEKVSFAASTPLAIMQGLALATADANGRPDHAAINQAILIAMAVLQFQNARSPQKLPVVQ